MRIKNPVSNANKIREKMGKLTQQREEFATKEKELQTKLTVGADNLEKIQKELKNNDVVEASILQLDQEDDFYPIRKSRNSSPVRKRANTDPNNSPQKETQVLNGMNIVESFIMPSGQRVSDWCFTSSFDSTPPGITYHTLQ
jgi:hypothetical protein